MDRKIVITADGSTTIHLVDWDEQYHSKHGAIQEAEHVFIQTGLFCFCDEPVKILEIGFGTGLNCMLTMLRAPEKKLTIDYTGIEAYPVSNEELSGMNFSHLIKEPSSSEIFKKIHSISWEEKTEIKEKFNLIKRKLFFHEITDLNAFDLIYFDAFGPRVQPELWTLEIFEKMYKALKKGGILVTYSAKGSVRRNMQQVGFDVERLPGPPGKREMLRAIKK